MATEQDEHPPLIRFEAALWSALIHRGHSALAPRNTDANFRVFLQDREAPIVVCKDAALQAMLGGEYGGVDREGGSVTTLKRIPGYSYIENPTAQHIIDLRFRRQLGEIADIKDAYLPDIVFFKRAKKEEKVTGLSFTITDCSVASHRHPPTMPTIDTQINEATERAHCADKTIHPALAILLTISAFLFGTCGRHQSTHTSMSTDPQSLGRPSRTPCRSRRRPRPGSSAPRRFGQWPQYQLEYSSTITMAPVRSASEITLYHAAGIPTCCRSLTVQISGTNSP